MPRTPRVKMKIDIVTRENKILTHGLNEKNPTIMYVSLESSYVCDIEENVNVTKFTVSPPNPFICAHTWTEQTQIPSDLHSPTPIPSTDGERRTIHSISYLHLLEYCNT